ncbi:MAG TPA: hypothetical protein VL860_12095 [Planctomycetota bacterium]|nr:hypothetical protein [Planctomycetota bacterium]
MTTGLQSDPRQWHRSRAWTDALVKALPPQQPMTLERLVVGLNPPEFGCETIGSDVRIKLGDTALYLRSDAAAHPGVLFPVDSLLATDGSPDGKKGVKLLDEWLRSYIAQVIPPIPTNRVQPGFWAAQPVGAKNSSSRKNAPPPPGSRRYRLRLDFLLPTPHVGLLKAQGGSFAEALANAAQLHWYVSGSFLNVADRGAYAGRIQKIGAGSTHQPPQTGAKDAAIAVAPRFAAWIELGGGRDRLIQAALELRRLADTLASDVCLRGEMGLVTDAAPALSGAPEDLFLWSGSLNWGERLLMSWEQAGWLRELVDFLVELHRKRSLNESLLRTLGQAAQWTDRGEQGTVKVVLMLSDYFDRHGRNRHFPADTARRLALSLGRNEKFLRHRPYPTKPGLARVDELTALAVRLVRLQCGLKRASRVGRYGRARDVENNGAVQTAARAAGANSAAR